jgi:hypothetical protein
MTTANQKNDIESSEPASGQPVSERPGSEQATQPRPIRHRIHGPQAGRFPAVLVALVVLSLVLGALVGWQLFHPLP